ncbi:hypothetical protein IB286_12305 [Spongiibacter sp. KMU-158]|uniref:EF-hand domain-containing protein n=1 Tax=Spongiibacter pelagi TaxID=2760804 RepID=A0A927GWI6_9GAMM|nr:hypothetical protein [Spongiibacter pelagi]MBD2859786.1 hypothetical protein [Spongiibacter pelagi]
MNASTTLKFAAATLLLAVSTYTFAEMNGPRPEFGPEGRPSIEQMAQHHAQRFMKMDLNADGSVTRAEIEEFKAQQREQRTGSREDRFSRADTDNNGMVSSEEAQQLAMLKLTERDANGDGQLDRGEFHRGEFRKGEHHKGGFPGGFKHGKPGDCDGHGRPDFAEE